MNEKEGGKNEGASKIIVFADAFVRDEERRRRTRPIMLSDYQRCQFLDSNEGWEKLLERVMKEKSPQVREFSDQPPKPDTIA